MQRAVKSVLLVGLQVVAIGHLALTGPIIAVQPVCLTMEIFGLLLGLWAVFTMRLRHVCVFPDVTSSTRLTFAGPYRVIRHPMYASVQLVTLALLINHFSMDRLAAWIVLFVVLLVKIRIEEALLAARFTEYIAYQQRTKRLVPFVY